MIRLQDIADMAGVSRTTVSNVINGNTKRVSQKTIDTITAILKEVTSGSICGRTDRNDSDGNGRKRILCYAYRW